MTLILGLTLSGCVNIADHYGVALCGVKACDYQWRKSEDYPKTGAPVILETKYDYSLARLLSFPIIKSSEVCLIGYAVIHGTFPSDQEVFEFNKNIEADYILYGRLETTDSLLIEPPFKVTYLEENFAPKKISLIYFYVDKKRAVTCFNPSNLNNY